MPYWKGFCEKKMKAGQKGIIVKQEKTVKSTHAFNDDFWFSLPKNEVKNPHSGTHRSILVQNI